MKLIYTEQDAAQAAKALGINFDQTPYKLEDLLAGMNVELKHGSANPATNTTNDDPTITAKMALANLSLVPLYYAPKVGHEAWAASLRKGVKQKSAKTEYKSVSFKLEDVDEEQGIVSGYAAVFGNLDSGGDIIEPGAFTKTIAEGWQRVKILSGHNDGLLPIGKPLELREDATGLFLRAQISDTAMGRDIKQLLRDGVLSEFSIGYDPVIFNYDSDGVRHLREVKLWEVSVVTWAMNEQAIITDYKARQQTPEAPKAQPQRKKRQVKYGKLKINY